MQTSSTYADAQWSPIRNGELVFWKSSFVEQFVGVDHLFTPIGFNMSATSGSDTSSTMNRRTHACEVVGSSIAMLTCAKQAHGTDIAVVRHGEERGVLLNMDGFVTSDRGVALMVFTADCPNIVVFDPKRKAIGLAHSGWKGTCLNIVGHLLSTMAREFETDASEAFAAMGPCAGGCCYEIKEDVASQVRQAATNTEPIIREHESKLYLNLPMMIAKQLEAAGIPGDHIALPNQCTICDERFYSYRRQGPNAGQAALVVNMKE